LEILAPIKYWEAVLSCYQFCGTSVCALIWSSLVKPCDSIILSGEMSYHQLLWLLFQNIFLSDVVVVCRPCFVRSSYLLCASYCGLRIWVWVMTRLFSRTCLVRW
jgi:hypothetical protein